MSTQTLTASRRKADRSSPIAGTATLVRFMLRRDRLKLTAWAAGLGLYVVYIGTAIPEVAPTEADLSATVPLLGQPIGRMFTGPGYGLQAPTYEQFYAAGYVLYLYILAALMNIMLIARHTRGEEQSGRAELVRANVTGRHTALTAALIVALITNLTVGAVVTGLSMAYDFASTGSALIGLGVALVGMAFAGITAVTVQLSEYARAAAGLAGAVLGLAFVLRAVGDMAALGGSVLSWVSPLGWASQTAPYVLDRWWPLLLHVALAGVTIPVAFALQSRRDFGAGLIAARRGRPDATPALGSPWGLAARLQRNAAIAWGTGIAALGVIDGLFAQAMVDAAGELPEALGQVLGGDALISGYVALLAILSACLTSAYVVFAVLALRAEERSGRADTVLATPVSRRTWAGSHYGVVAAWATTIMLITGVFVGLAAAAVTGDWTLVWDNLLAHANLLPGVLVTLGLCALLYGWIPSLLAAVGWALVGLMVFVGTFASLLDPPDWVIGLSPLNHPSQVPVEDLDLAPLLILLGIAALGVVVGLVGLHRRQIRVR